MERDKKADQLVEGLRIERRGTFLSNEMLARYLYVKQLKPGLGENTYGAYTNLDNTSMPVDDDSFWSSWGVKSYKTMEELDIAFRGFFGNVTVDE